MKRKFGITSCTQFRKQLPLKYQTLTSVISFVSPTWDFCGASSNVKGWRLEGVDDIMLSNAGDILIIKKGATEAYGINFCQDHLETHKRMKAKCQSLHCHFENDKNLFTIIWYNSRCTELGNCWEWENTFMLLKFWLDIVDAIKLLYNSSIHACCFWYFQI